MAQDNQHDHNEINALVQVALQMDLQAIGAFSLLLQKGVRVGFTAGVSISDFLCGQMGITPQYLDGRIQTIFLDGKAVDHPQSQILANGASLSMAAAMPGLAGATLRRDGHFVGFRTGITQDCQSQCLDCDPGILTLKLFNLLIKEIGPQVLAHGIIMSAEELGQFMRERPESFWQLCQGAHVMGQETGLKRLRSLDWLPQGKEAQLKVDLS